MAVFVVTKDVGFAVMNLGVFNSEELMKPFVKEQAACCKKGQFIGVEVFEINTPKSTDFRSSTAIPGPQGL